MRGPWRPRSGSSLSARARISTPRNDPELWPTMTISSASLLPATLTRCRAKRSMRCIPFRPLAVREFPSPDRIGQQIERVGAVFGVFQHRVKRGDESARRDRQCSGCWVRPALAALCQGQGDGERQQRFIQQHVMRIADEGRKSPMRLPEPGNRAVEHQAPIDPDRVENRAPDRLSKVALNQVFPAQEIVAGAGLPVVCLGLDGPGRGFVAAVLCGRLMVAASW